MMDPLKMKSEQELAQDLARLQLVRKEREEAAKKREDETKGQLTFALFGCYVNLTPKHSN